METEHGLIPNERPAEILAEWRDYLEASEHAVEVAKREIQYWEGQVDAQS